MTGEQEYLRRIEEAGLLNEYNEILSLVKRAMALEDDQPKKAVPLYRQAYDRVEATGAVAGAVGHPLFQTRNSILQFVGELANRGIEI